MDHTYAKRKPAPEADPGKDAASAFRQAAAPVRSLDAQAGTGDATRLDLSESIRAKMEHAFGMELDTVKLYESPAVAEHGAGAVAQGNTIAFAPGRHDFGSRAGQELLGHELSHVASQRRGEVTGSGFLRSAALEARADREGAMAAAGGQIYDGPVTGPLSGVTADAAEAGPIQAWKPWGKKKKAPAQTSEVSSPPAAAAAEPAEDDGAPRELTSQKRADEFFGKGNGGAYDTWRKELSDEESNGLKDYTFEGGPGDYEKINTRLRKGEDVYPDLDRNLIPLGPEQVKDLQAQTKAMDSAIDKFNLEKPIIVHRGSGASLLNGKTNPTAIMEEFGNGRRIRDNGFMSTSAVKGGRFDGQIHYIITVPAGKGRGAYVAPLSHREEENEFLLKRGSEFVVRNAYKDGNQTVVELEVQE